MILEADRASALDENTRAFLKTFVEHVMTITRDDRRQMALVARVNVLLLAALAGGEGAPSAWHLLYRTIAEVVENQHAVDSAGRSYAYLLSFVSENGDLAHD